MFSEKLEINDKKLLEREKKKKKSNFSFGFRNAANFFVFL